MHDPGQEFLASAAVPLGWYYLAGAALNAGAAAVAWRQGKLRTQGVAWVVVTLVFAVLGLCSFAGIPPRMPGLLKAAVDAVLGPVTLFLGSMILLVVLFVWRRFFVIPAVAWAVLNVSLLFMGLSLTDPNFAAIVTRPDNVPIVAMVYLLGFFLWLGAAQAVRNDERLAAGREPVEKQYSDTVLVWPDLVYIELISMVILTVVLIVWSLSLRAPLEQPANPVVTPNPSKAPWYFLGLQEMLVFFDPAIAGVIIPALIIFGLAAIPYLDVNPRGSGYYSIAQRRFACAVFLFGFLQLWILLILVGTFMRGPNWNFFGLYEVRDPHKVLALNNIKLSEYFWVIWLGGSMPDASTASGLEQLGRILWREIAGVVLLVGYFIGLPLLLARTVLKNLRQQMGLARYVVMTFLLLFMLTLPLKMILRWSFNLSYLVSMPEYFFNF